MMAQAIALAKRPHIVVGTPGRLVDHLTNTKGFSLRTIKYLVRSLLVPFLRLVFGDYVSYLPLLGDTRLLQTVAQLYA